VIKLGHIMPLIFFALKTMPENKSSFCDIIYCCMQALLNVYLLPDVTAHNKQMILLYTFCDMLSLASSEGYKTQVVAYKSVVL